MNGSSQREGEVEAVRVVHLYEVISISCQFDISSFLLDDPFEIPCPVYKDIKERYVVEKDVKYNVVFVSYSVDKRRRSFRVGSFRWISGSPPRNFDQLRCKIWSLWRKRRRCNLLLVNHNIGTQHSPIEKRATYDSRKLLPNNTSRYRSCDKTGMLYVNLQKLYQAKAEADFLMVLEDRDRRESGHLLEARYALLDGLRFCERDGSPIRDIGQRTPFSFVVKCLSLFTQVGKTLSVKRWQASFTPEGSLDIGKCLNRICQGGIHPPIRGHVWEFQLGCYDPKSTFDEREHIRQRQRDQYAQLKESCSLMFSVGSGKFITVRVITANGDPIQDPTVLLGTDLEQLPKPESQESVNVKFLSPKADETHTLTSFEIGRSASFKDNKRAHYDEFHQVRDMYAR
ncbi:Rab-GTPase-TBC domain-containing protein, partial [Tanacetum coccineum]